MFESLSTRLQGVFKTLRGETRLTPEHIETVVLKLVQPPLPLDPADTAYSVARPESAAAFIVDNDTPAPPPVMLPGGIFHFPDHITNGCFRVEVTTNLVNWEIICTNAVADGMALCTPNVRAS